MEEIDKSINKKTSILLSRNNPIALVVGAAGFLGSHLVDKLLDKGIQVVGVDNLETGKRENLQKAIGNRNFHLVLESADKCTLDPPRVDYIFIISSGEWDLHSILELFKKNKSRCLFVSSIDLYEKSHEDSSLDWFSDGEIRLAKFATTNKLNARVLRLGPVYGPRMHFRTKDPIVRLIHQELNGDLQKEVSLDFSSRALYVIDAIDLMVKTIFAGSTAQKIFDGVQPSPIKVSEIKQVLLDPIWYENKDFTPSELPPWPTPNLDKTSRFLNWYPKAKLVSALRQTLSYFKDNEILIPKLEVVSDKEEEKVDESWKKEKKEELESLKALNENKSSKEKPKKRRGLPKFPIPLSKIYLFLLIVLITYSLIWPMVVLGGGILTFRYQLNEAVKNLTIGEFEKSLTNINYANRGVLEAKSIFDDLEPIRKLGMFKNEFEVGDNLADLSALSVDSAKNTVLGVQEILQSLKRVTGESTESPVSYFTSAQIHLASADTDLSKAEALTSSVDFNKKLPKILQGSVKNIQEKLKSYSALVKKARVISVLLPSVVAMDGNKSYLILLQNNMELRPTGGFIGSFAKVSFEGGKLKKLDVSDVYVIDGQLSIHVEPPKEIKNDLGQKDWFFRDSNWEPDFPTSARQAEWFYNKEVGERVEGVIALDISAMEDLISVVGPLDLADYSEKITPENLFEKAVTHAESSFFPGSQAKKSFLTALTNQLLNKIFFLPGQSWSGIVSSLGKSLEQKHMSVYLDDTKLFSYLTSQNWTNTFPRQSNQDSDTLQDFLSVVEANLGANKANYYLDRSYNLETVITKDGEVNQRLRIAYTNRSPSNAFPGGKYKDRIRFYLPFGSKLNRALWTESDVTSTVTNFVDYGRTGYSMLLELAPKEQKTLVLDYQLPKKVEFKKGVAKYRLDVIKQAGLLKDPFTWKISYPINYKLMTDKTLSLNIGPQEQTIQTDLSLDRSFEVEFKK